MPGIETKIREVVKYFKANLCVALNPKDVNDLIASRDEGGSHPDISNITFEGFRVIAAPWVKEGEVKIHFGDENAN